MRTSANFAKTFGREIQILLDRQPKRVHAMAVTPVSLPCHKSCNKLTLQAPLPLKLFLDIVPSSSEDVPRSMRGQPKRLSQNDARRNGESVILCVLVSLRPGFRLFFCLFGCSLFCSLFGFKELNYKQTSTATDGQRQGVQWLYKRAL